MKEETYANSLAKEKSPYLLQHAHNPVDWHPWNEKTIELAKKVDKPVFLSIGYSTCYWCHVMEREVFENPEIAKMMNEYFINVKVDREERPDIDRVYMTALQAMTGSGGWPMSMFLTPDLKPFYGATYIPPKAKYGRAGFEDVITRVHEAWEERKDEIKQSGDKIISTLLQMMNVRSEGKAEPDSEILSNAFEQVQKIYDEENGGFGQGNKFPRPVVFNFLLDYYYHSKDFAALDMVTYTLKKMYEGGMYDHLAGGFHRYSVDPYWRVPHFEKMLYDQAQLIVSYVNTYLVTKNKFYLFVAEDIAGYVLNSLKNKDGGFYSAEDAESVPVEKASKKNVRKEEGAYNLWQKSEIEKILDKDESEIFNYYFGILAGGNTINDPHEVFGTKNVLYIANDIYDTARQFNRTPEDIASIIDESRSKILQSRNERPKPHLDDKILTSWNGLMVSALASLYKVTGDLTYLNNAEETVEFIKANLFNNNRRHAGNNDANYSPELLHRYRDGDARFDGTLEDYAYFIAALLDLYEVTFEIDYLKLAAELNRIAVDRFYDKSAGGFFDTSPEEKDIIIRTKEIYDGAEPSGNSIQVLNLLRISAMTDNRELHDLAGKTLSLFAAELKRLPFSSPQMLSALSFYLYTTKEIILTGDSASKKFTELKKVIDGAFLPNKVLLYANNDLKEVSEFILNVVKQGRGELVYVCENYQCALPTDDVVELNKILKL